MAADIVIVDYGMANLRSVQKAFEAVGAHAEVTADPARAGDAKKPPSPSDSPCRLTCPARAT